MPQTPKYDDSSAKDPKIKKADIYFFMYKERPNLYSKKYFANIYFLYSNFYITIVLLDVLFICLFIKTKCVSFNLNQFINSF